MILDQQQNYDCTFGINPYFWATIKTQTLETLFNFHFSIIQWVILTLFTTSFLVQLGYYIFFMRKIVFHKSKTINTPSQPVSVVICSENHGTELEENLVYFLEQDYPSYEVVVVDDCSLDQTETILTRFKRQYPHLRTTTIKPDPKFNHNIKLATTIGIKAASYDQILFSTPYCRPVTRYWLKEMQSHFTPKNNIVLGYWNYPYKKGFFHQLIRYDIFFESIKHFSFAIAKKPYAGSGNNLAYTKSSFLAQKGFARNARTPDGYDHLMVYNLGRKGDIATNYKSRSRIENRHPHPLTNWRNVYENYFGTRTFFTSKFKILLDLEPISRIIFHISFFFLLFPTQLLVLSLPLWMIRMVLFLISIKITSKHWEERKIFISSYVNDILLIFIKTYLFLRIRVLNRSN